MRRRARGPFETVEWEAPLDLRKIHIHNDHAGIGGALGERPILRRHVATGEYHLFAKHHFTRNRYSTVRLKKRPEGTPE